LFSQPALSSSGEVGLVLGVEDAKLVVAAQHEAGRQVAERPKAGAALKREDGLALVTLMPISA
jgi:hypothetical protein